MDLVCNATARPPATIEWTRLGGALLPIGQEKKLVGIFFLVSRVKLYFRFSTCCVVKLQGHLLSLDFRDVMLMYYAVHPVTFAAG